MTEELEEEAEEYIKKDGTKTEKLLNSVKLSLTREEATVLINAIKQSYIDGAEPREKRIAELEAQIEKMKCCENCAWWYKLPNGQRDCAEHCENLDNWSLRS